MGTKSDKHAGDVYAAIALALHLCQTDDGTHDVESNILTISQPSRIYSPWSNKSFTVRELPRKK